ncbi:site-specific integrase [Polaribacter ponticola]|uniref:Site-specific integrase n=1 Tax=Polaribacter ponticola TaxID=2978475 RepID=A0ABT5S9Z7_9FLAO|nr:site-specific integrase [Polaribacter sp. MSW5]MDD7914915.1 site-specific integrase [Polaribacter sp. MSW5]
MQHLFSFIFYIKRSKADKNGKANIYLRITVNGKRAELSISRKVDVQKWSSSASKMKGSSGEAQQLNKYIDSIANRIYKIHQRLVEENKLITAINIRNIFQGKNEVRKMTLEIFENHNIEMEKLVGKDYALGTSERYKTAKKHLKNYINHEYKIEDIPVTEIDNKFITGFEYYLKTEKNCAHNTTIKYITNFKKIVRIAYANDWIVKDPFFNWKGILKTVEREFLDEEEIQRLIEKEFSIHRLNLVKDIFVFSCFTGLAYADVKALNKDNIVIGIDGGRWIKTTRKKTKTKSNIPLLASAEIILKKYEEDSDVLNSNNLLPILSNQKMNAYLKEIADLCEINKNLTFHLARHTFATTVTLTNGVPIESVSKMLGHKSLKTTQHYAKIIDRKVSEDMASLKEKLYKTQLNNHPIQKID